MRPHATCNESNSHAEGSFFAKTQTCQNKLAPFITWVLAFGFALLRPDAAPRDDPDDVLDTLGAGFGAGLGAVTTNTIHVMFLCFDRLQK